ncbi:MAG: hypothetical protein V4495_07280 [Pseudomonadota bacterium]
MNKRTWIWVSCLSACSVMNAFAAEPADGKDKQKDDLSAYLIDVSAGSVSAAGMLGISGEAITNVQNVKDVVLALNGFGGNKARPAFGIAITPARTSLTPMSLQNYASNDMYRLLGSLALAYAQGDATIEGNEYQRRAISMEVNYYFNKNDDPIIAHANELSLGLGDCKFPDPEKPIITAEELKKLAEGGAMEPQKDKSSNAADRQKRLKACRDQALKNIKWNASQMSFSAATGRIQANAGNANEISLGRTVALSATWGLTGNSDNGDQRLSALSFIFRRTIGEPVLTSLSSPAIEYKNSSLMALRYMTGSNETRGLLEVSNAKSSQVTASQRTFKLALGVDKRLSEDLWLTLRLGRQSKINGSGEETGTLLNINYSPKALLNF